MKALIKVTFIITFFLIFLAPVNAFAGYKLIFDGKELKLSGKDTVLDLGKLKVQSSSSFRINVKNESSEIFQITNVRGNCGLSIPSWPRNSIKPNEEQHIQIRFDTSSPGNYTKNLTIHSNTRNSRTIIPIVAEIIP